MRLQGAAVLRSSIDLNTMNLDLMSLSLYPYAGCVNW
jgi:hypothetical protein